MAKSYRKILLVVLLCSLLLIGSCGIEIGDWAQAKYERMVHQQAPLAAGATLVAETTAGSITVAGTDVNDCNVVATISARAPTEEQAQQIAEQVNVKIETVGQTLTVRAEKPPLESKRSVSVSFKITVPKQTSTECTSSYGSIELSNLNGSANGKTSSGSINVTNIQGSANLNTSYGSITCRNIAGQSIKLKSSSGSLTAENIKGSVLLETSYGSVTCNDVSGGDIKLKSSSGKITLSKASFGHCDAHTSYGSIVTDELKGDSIRLHSDSGSINVTTASANTIAASTSYGRINCQQITTSNLTTRSGSGNIDIACSQSAPPELSAEVATSYGSIDFTSPPNFAGQVDLKTSYGSIRTDLPIIVTGEITKKHIQGKIGDGKGKLHLQTSSGSIIIK